MPIEVRRFGVGHRRPDGPPGSEGVTGQVIHSDARGAVSELAFGRGGRIEPHANPNTTYFVVVHAAWADYSPMRAFVVEFAGADDAEVRGILAGIARELLPGDEPVSRADGRLIPSGTPRPHDRSQGEPL
jgi:hypothetical protein